MSTATRRGVHPLAWWLWALALGAAALRTRNPLLLGLLVAVAWFVVASRRTEAPWARSFGSFARIGVAIIVLRLVLQTLFGVRLPGRVLFTIPEVELPGWAAGASLGGPVTAEALVNAFYEGLQLAALLACVGAANSLAAPYRLLRAMPAVLYQLGVIVTVAFSFAPQAIITTRRVREARRLRGRPHRGLRGLRGMALPVLEGALERSLELAASMDSRGYGRRGTAPPRTRRLAEGASLAGTLAVCAGAYGVLDQGGPSALGVPMLLAGGGLVVVALVVASRGSTRSRYRPDPWAGPEWITAGAGAVALAGLAAAAAVELGGLVPPTSPLGWPTLPLLPAAAIVVAALPALATPRPQGAA